jgi:hypothetical protein
VQHKPFSQEDMNEPGEEGAEGGRGRGQRNRIFQSKELIVNQGFLMQKYQGQCSQNYANNVLVKVPMNREETVFQTVAQPLWIFPPMIGGLSPAQMQNGYFQEKMTWLRFQAEKLRINWEHGCEVILVDRHNVLMSSAQQLEKINLRKEIKIRFDNEEVDDAGGVLREWMNLACKEIFNFEVAGLFKLCNADETAYRFVLDPEENEDEQHFRLVIARLLGMIIGKALFERISLSCYLTKSIWRQVCGKKVREGDFFFYDRDIYKNLNFIRDNECGTELGLNFTYLVPADTKEGATVSLKPSGEALMVTDHNKKEFISLVVAYFCTRTCSSYVQALREGIEAVLPVKYLEIFEPYEMEMLVNGPQSISVQEWRQSTIYKNCGPGDKEIQWFWKYVEGLDQQHLGNLLHYVTGTRRVPILGFNFLESNRNEIRRFTIEKVAYEKHNPYPKGHTCFNRLELPHYHTEKEMKVRMDTILKEEINSFGLS